MDPNLGIDDAKRKALNIMVKIQLLTLIRNVVGGISLVSAFVAPFILSYYSGNWSNLLFLLVYPILVAILSALRYKGIMGEGILVLPLLVITLKNILPVNPFIIAIILGIIISYYLQFFAIPSLEKEFDRYSSIVSSPQ
jgi:hypothetical protein